MKNALLIASAVAATSLFALDSNEIAYQPVSNPPSANADGGKHLLLLAASVTGYGTGSSGKIAVADVLLTTGLATGDKLYIQKSGGEYNSYTLQANGKWQANKVATVGASGFSAGSSDSAENAEIDPGKAFWLETAATDVTLLGQASASSASSVVAGFQLLSSKASATAITLGSITGAAKGDIILLADGTRYQMGRTKWMKVADAGTLLSVPTDASEVTIAAGVGFWYNAAASGSRTL